MALEKQKRNEGGKLTMYRSRAAVKSNRARTRTRFSLDGRWLSLGINLKVIVPSAFCCRKRFKVQSMRTLTSFRPSLLLPSLCLYIQLSTEIKNRSIVYQNLKDVVRRFAQNINAVDFNHFVARMDQSGSVGSSAVHDAGNHNLPRPFVGFDSCTLHIHKKDGM